MDRPPVCLKSPSAKHHLPPVLSRANVKVKNGRVSTPHTLRKTFSCQFLLLLPLLRLDPIFPLQPRFRRFVRHGFHVLLHLREELRDAADVVGLAFFRGMIAGWKVAECWTWREKGKEVWGEFVRHGESESVVVE